MGKGQVTPPWGKGRTERAAGTPPCDCRAILLFCPVLLGLGQGFPGLLAFLPAWLSVAVTSSKPIFLCYQLKAVKALYQLEEGRTVVWTAWACCSVVLLDKFIHPGYGCRSQQISNLSDRREVCERGRKGRAKGVCALGK